jgi:hypothetical protein
VERYVGKSTRKTSRSGGCGVSGLKADKYQRRQITKGRVHHMHSRRDKASKVGGNKQKGLSNGERSKVVEIAKWTAC